MSLARRVRGGLSELMLFVMNDVVAFVPSHKVRQTYMRRVMRFEIGDESAVLLGCSFDQRRGLRIGAKTTINKRCRIDTRGSVWIGDNVSISSSVTILTADHDLHSPSFEGRERAVRIEDHAFVGTGATVLPGITIGTGAAVAAGAIVTRDVEPYAIVAGNPARPIGSRSRSLEYQLTDYRRLFH